MNVGFIGLGNQGAPIARMICRAGYTLSVWDKSENAISSFDEPGAQLLDGSRSVATNVDILCTCVRTDQDVRDVVDGGKLFEALGPDGIFIVHSTIHPSLCRELAGLGSRFGVSVLDAGVSGSVEGALSRSLPVSVGGSHEAFEKALCVMQAYGDPVRYFGESGRGMEAKLVNNLLSIANFGLAAAALDVAAAMGFQPESLRETMLAGSGGSFGLRNVHRILDPERRDGVRSLLQKDFDHVRDVARVTGPAANSLQLLEDVAQALLDRLVV